MKIENKEVNNTINNITKKEFKAVLVYGDDVSSVFEKYNKILNNFIKENYEVYNINMEEIRNNKNFLIEKFISISMFSKNTVYTLKILERENELTKYLEEFDKIDIKNDFLIITTSALDTKSSLRKYAEKSKNIACIASYEESNIEAFISTELKKNNFIFNNEIVKYISQNVGNNTLIIRNEIYKLSLYKNDEKNLTIDNIKKCIIDISENNLNDFTNNFFLLNCNETIKIYRKLINENIDTIVLIRMLTKYSIQLQKMKQYIDNGENIENVLKYENIFWKQKNFTKMHLSKWKIDSINKILYKLLELEKDIKFNTNKSIYFENFILKLMIYFNKNNKI